MTTSDFTWLYLFGIVYRIITVLVGFGFAMLGYKLFCRGIYTSPSKSDVRLSRGKTSLTLKQVAPGTLFALFGMTVIGICLMRPGTFSFDSRDVGIEAPLAPLSQTTAQEATGRGYASPSMALASPLETTVQVFEGQGAKQPSP